MSKSAAREVVAGLYRVPLGFVNVYLLLDPITGGARSDRPVTISSW